MEKITDEMRKRRILFCGHVARMGSVTLTNKNFTKVLENKTKSAWFTEIEREVRITKYGCCPGGDKLETDKQWSQAKKEATTQRTNAGKMLKGDEV